MRLGQNSGARFRVHAEVTVRRHFAHLDQHAIGEPRVPLRDGGGFGEIGDDMSFT
jgi:hypothetical protein